MIKILVCSAALTALSSTAWAEGHILSTPGVDRAGAGLTVETDNGEPVSATAGKTGKAGNSVSIDVNQRPAFTDRTSGKQNLTPPE